MEQWDKHSHGKACICSLGSDVVFANTSVRPPHKVCIAIMHKTIYKIKYPRNNSIDCAKPDKHWSAFLVVNTDASSSHQTVSFSLLDISVRLPHKQCIVNTGVSQ